jgi:hypothetical protein
MEEDTSAGAYAFSGKVFVSWNLGKVMWHCLQKGIRDEAGQTIAEPSTTTTTTTKKTKRGVVATTPAATPARAPTHVVVVTNTASGDIYDKAQRAYPGAEIVTQQWVVDRKNEYIRRRKAPLGRGGGGGGGGSGSGSGSGSGGGGGGPSSSIEAAKLTVVATPASAFNRSASNRYDSESDEEYCDQQRHADRARAHARAAAATAAAPAGPRQASNNAASLVPPLPAGADVDVFPANHPNRALVSPPVATAEDHTLYGRTPGKTMGSWERVMQCKYDANASKNEDIVAGLYNCSI